MTMEFPHLRPDRRRMAILVGAVVVAAAIAVIAFVLLVGPALSRRDRVPTVLVTPPAGTVLPVPDFTHVYLVVLENKDVGQVVGHADAPYLNDLIERYGLAEAYQAVARPSQPNYIALISGRRAAIGDRGQRAGAMATGSTPASTSPRSASSRSAAIRNDARASPT